MNILVKPSKRQPIVFSALFILTAVVVLLLHLHVLWKVLALFGLGLGVFIFKHQPVIRLKKNSADHWEVEYLSGKILSGKLSGNSISNQFFSIIILKPTNRLIQKSALIFHDSLNRKEYHRLRLHLKGLLN